MSKLLVPVVKIDAIEPIEGADKIELVKVLGWQCIVSKGAYRVGDLCIFVPPDSILPDTLIERNKLEFLKKGGKVGVLKLRKTVSQGLILDCDNIPNYNKTYDWEGQNVAETLKITKWEPPERPEPRKKETIKDWWIKYREGKTTLRRFMFKSIAIIKFDYFTPKRRRNPNFTEYTDIDNIKHYPTVFENGEKVSITEKLHGSNFRAGYLEGEERGTPIVKLLTWFKRVFFKQTYQFCYGSRTVQKTWYENSGWYGEDIWYKMVKKYNLDKIIPKDYVLYGEIVGPNVQDLTYGLKEMELRFFDAKYKGVYLGYEDKVKLFASLNLPMVPVLYTGEYSKEMVEKQTKGKSILCPSQIREGCVVTSYEETTHPRLGRKILKSISEDYLTRKGGTEYH